MFVSYYLVVFIVIITVARNGPVQCTWQAK